MLSFFKSVNKYRNYIQLLIDVWEYAEKRYHELFETEKKEETKKG